MKTRRHRRAGTITIAGAALAVLAAAYEPALAQKTDSALPEGSDGAAGEALADEGFVDEVEGEREEQIRDAARAGKRASEGATEESLGETKGPRESGD